MQNILTGLYGKFTGSTLSTYVGGRIYFMKSRSATYPQVVYDIATISAEGTFSDKYKVIRFTFNLYSSSSSDTELATMYNYLHSLLDKCTMTITSNKLVSMVEVVTVPITEIMTTATGEQQVECWCVDYDMIVSSA